MKNNFLLHIILITAVSLFFVSTVNIQTSAAYKFLENSGLKETGQETGHTAIGLTEKISQSPGKVVGTIIEALLSFLGVVFLIIIIYGGYIWMMARGNEQETGKAKNIIFDAAVGLIIVLLAYAITIFIGAQLISGVTP